ncbi:MAG TPA: DUF222 domain-containing protein [Acidimicrobiales bacterium]|nr:DUF222 domain-containing protein [Acidimicrobiales bacterium]
MTLTDETQNAPPYAGREWAATRDGPPSTRTLDDRLAEIMGLLNVCTAELVGLISEALCTDAWQGIGIRSVEHWVTWKCGVSPWRARRLVTIARALADLPETAKAFATGRLTEDQTAVVVRHTDAAHDREVADLATSLTVPQLSRVLPSVPRSRPTPPPAGFPADDTTDPDTTDPNTTGPDTNEPGTTEPGGADIDGDEAPAPDSASATTGVAGRDLGARRQVAMGYDDEGGFWCAIHLPGDEGALVERALTQARQVEFTHRHPRADDDDLVETPGVTWADALLRLVESGLAGLDPATAAGRPPSERTQVIVHLDADRDVPPRLHLGPLLPPSIADHLACDATVRHLLWRDGIPVARGRRRRTVPPGLRTIIEHRDQSCRVPGCGHARWLHIHHLVHWSRGGATDPANLLALCPTHHRMVHKGRLVVTGDPGRAGGLRWTDGKGRELVPARPRPPVGPPVETARSYGLPDPGWRHPVGEPLDSRWISWS